MVDYLIWLDFLEDQDKHVLDARIQNFPLWFFAENLLCKGLLGNGIGVIPLGKGFKKGSPRRATGDSTIDLLYLFYH